MELEIKLYEPWMKMQIVKLICSQYNYNEKDYTNFFEKFYESNYQKKSLKIVALDKKKVVGFQSFFLWPYAFKNKTYNSFQSGNSIVDSNYRGKGIFQKMLNFVYDKNELFNISFFVGFPVQASFNSFIRNGWENPFNLKWHIKIINPLSFLFTINNKQLSTLFQTQTHSYELNNNSKINLANSNEFVSWRNFFSKDKKYYFTYEYKKDRVEFGLKLNRRKKIITINELIIGELNTTSYDPEFLEKAFVNLLNEIKKIRFVTITSIAINPNSNTLNKVLKKANFKQSKKEINFIIKDFSNSKEIQQFHSWELYRGDIDTW